MFKHATHHLSSIFLCIFVSLPRLGSARINILFNLSPCVGQEMGGLCFATLLLENPMERPWWPFYPDCRPACRSTRASWTANCGGGSRALAVACALRSTKLWPTFSSAVSPTPPSERPIPSLLRSKHRTNDRNPLPW